VPGPAPRADPVPAADPARRDPRWWIRRLRLLRARVAHEPPAVPAGRQRLTISHCGGVVGVMLYQVCDDCRRGLVGKVSIDSHLQGLGLGAVSSSGRSARTLATAGTPPPSTTPRADGPPHRRRVHRTGQRALQPMTDNLAH
jgi:hypothetical protein